LAKVRLLEKVRLVEASKGMESASKGHKLSEMKIGIIGGTGLEDPDILENRSEKAVMTPFGAPSDVLILGKIAGVPCVLLSRHDKNHTIAPTQVNYRANIYALKQEGCTHILSGTACGSLQEHIVPGDLVFIDQFIDRTNSRKLSFYDGSVVTGVAHCMAGDPFCPRLRAILAECAKELGLKYHTKGTMVTIEGPRFSTRAESHMFRAWGGHVINMTTVPEVMLAKEAGLPYAAVAMATDYDCWRETEDAVSVEMVLKTLKGNADRAKSLFLKAVPAVAGKTDWEDYLEQNNMDAKMMILPGGNSVFESSAEHTPDGPIAREIAAVIPYYPFKKIDRFYDIGGLLAHPTLFSRAVDVLVARYAAMKVDKIGGFDARGFLFTPVALKLGIPFFMLRKKGKMPNSVTGKAYQVEYGSRDGLCIQRTSVVSGDRVVLIDDLVATGGTLASGIELVKEFGGTVVECGCMVELKFLKGKEKAMAAGAQKVWAFISEEILTVKGELPSGYVDDGEEH